jgi:hypothetical protein
VLITSPELAIDEPVTELAFPNTCQAFEPEGDRPWHVSCTPAYRKSLVEAAERAGELVLRFFSEHGEAREKRVPLGHERTFEPVASEVSSRAVACDPAVAPTRNVSVTLPSANWCCGYTPASILYLAVPGSPPLPLIDKDGWWQGCKAKDQGGAIEIQCPKQRHHAKIAVEGASLRFEWQDEHRNSGRVLLPCDVRATLIRPESFSGGNMYR